MVIALLPFRRRIAGDLFIHDFLCFKDKFMWALDDVPPPGLDLKDWVNESIKDDGLVASSVISYKISDENTLILAEIDIEEKKFMYEGHVAESYDDDVVWFQVIDIKYPIEGDPRRVMNPNWIDYYNNLYSNKSGFSSYFSKEFFRVKYDKLHLQYVLMILAEEYRTKLMPDYHIIVRKMKNLGL